MGVILGSIAAGVLIGYPFGGILYDMFDKSTPFFILSIILMANLGMFFTMYYYSLLISFTFYRFASNRIGLFLSTRIEL